MKKAYLAIMMLLGIVIPIFAMDSTTDQNTKKTVKMYHCTTPEKAQIILEDGLKSREQLAREGKAEVGELFKPTADHYRSIFFQYIEPSNLKKIGSRLWQRGDGIYCEHCVAIEIDPTTTMIYNPDLRILPAFGREGWSIDSKYSSNMQMREHTYKRSGMFLNDYIERRERFRQMRCGIGHVASPHPFTAEPYCVAFDVADKQTGYYWNEHTIQIDRIDPSEFVE